MRRSGLIAWDLRLSRADRSLLPTMLSATETISKDECPTKRWYRLVTDRLEVYVYGIDILFITKNLFSWTYTRIPEIEELVKHTVKKLHVKN